MSYPVLLIPFRFFCHSTVHQLNQTPSLKHRPLKNRDPAGTTSSSQSESPRKKKKRNAKTILDYNSTQGDPDEDDGNQRDCPNSGRTPTNNDCSNVDALHEVVGEEEEATFASLGLCDWILTACKAMGFRRPTPVQRQCIPAVS